MSAVAARLGRMFVNFAGYAYRTLVLYFFVMTVLRLLAGDGGWINEAIVFLILASAWAAAAAAQRLWKLRIVCDEQAIQSFVTRKRPRQRHSRKGFGAEKGQ